MISPQSPRISFASLEKELFDFADYKTKLLTDWYECPYDGKIGRLWGLNQELGKELEYMMPCYDLIPDHLGTPDAAHSHHRVRSLSELRRIENIKHTCNLDILWQGEARNQSGEVTQRLIQHADSLIAGYYMWLLEGQLSQATTAIATALGTGFQGQDTTDEHLTVFAVSTANFASIQAAGNSGTSKNGQQVGTGTTANNALSVFLASPIANGVAAGNLQYGADSYIALNQASNTVTFTQSKTFTNNSPTNPIGINEVQLGATGPAKVYQIERDVLGATFNIANGGASGTGTYTWSVTTS